MTAYRLKLAVIAGAALVVVTLIAGTIFLLDRTLQTAINTATQNTERSARVAENILNRQLLEVDSALASLPALFSTAAEMADGTVNTEAATRLLRGLNFQTFAFRDLILVNPDGTVWVSARPRPRKRPLPITLDAIGEPSPTLSRVIGPSRNPLTGEWTVFVVRAVAVPGAGRLAAIAEVPVSALTTPLTNIVDAPGWRLVIERPSGQRFGSLPHDELLVGVISPPDATEATGTARIRYGRTGIIEAITATRQTLYPDVRVTLELDGTVALQDWHRDRERLLLVVLGTMVLVALSTAGLLSALRRQDQLEAERRQAQRVLEDAIEAMSDGFVMWDENDRFVTCNQRYRELYAASAPYIFPGALFSDVIRKGVENGQYPQAGDDIEKFVADVTAWHRAGKGSFERLLPDGRWLLVTERRTASGGLVGIRTDITNLKIAHAELAAANARVQSVVEEVQQQNTALTERDLALRTQNMLFDAALNNMPHGLLMANADRRVIVCNRRFSELFGLPDASTLQGVGIADVFARAIAARSADRVLIADIQERQHHLAANRQADAFIAKSSTGQALAITQQPMQDGGFVAIYEDVTEQQRTESRIRFLAHHDALTKLPNRVLFRASLDEMLKSVPPDEGVAVLYLDLDKFKNVNDTLGHPAGDTLLEQVGQRLRQCLRESDLIARLGGDEFAIAFSAAEPDLAAAALAERIIAVVGASYTISRQDVSVGVSVGIALATGDAPEADTLLKNADMALYAAKAEGRGIWRCFEPAMEQTLHNRLEIEHDLKLAIRNEQLAVAYQPLVELRSRRIIGFEALLRWDHPTRGPISPAHFIPVAEETSAIREVGAWCLEKACADLAAWSNRIKLAVNLSPVQLRSDDIVETVRGVLDRTGFTPANLELEITEGALLDDDERVVGRLHQLHEMGVRIVLDDFGTGFSSLNYLRRFPFHKIKIDKVFVREATTRPDCSAIINSVVGLAERLGMATTAEGVETLEQYDLVLDLGCTEGQGFLFGTPQPILQTIAALNADAAAAATAEKPLLRLAAG